MCGLTYIAMNGDHPSVFDNRSIAMLGFAEWPNQTVIPLIFNSLFHKGCRFPFVRSPAGW